MSVEGPILVKEEAVEAIKFGETVPAGRVNIIGEFDPAKHLCAALNVESFA